MNRVVTALLLAAIGIPAILLGGHFYTLLITTFLAIAAWEFGMLFKTTACRPAMPLLVAGVVLIALSRAYLPVTDPVLLTILFLAAMAWHLVDYERGCSTPGTDLTITVTGIIYLGWIGAYLIDVRQLPDGLTWLGLVLPTVWVADSAAMYLGRAFGRHLLSPRLSPKKTWEGFISGVVIGTASTIGLAFLWHALGGAYVPWWQAGMLGLILTSLTPLGDLGESMIKRQAGVKDSSNLIPGHGGFLDRMDSWLWAGALGYLVITLFFL